MALISSPEDIAFIFENSDHTYTVGINKWVREIEKGKPVDKLKVFSEKVSKAEGEKLAVLMEKRKSKLDELTKDVPLKERDIRHYGRQET